MLIQDLMSGSLHCAVGSMSNGRSMGHKCKSQLSHISFMKIEQEIVSMVILPLPLIQKGKLSVTGESVSVSTGRLTDQLNITITVLTRLYNSNSD